MPRLNTRFKHMAFFLYRMNPRTNSIDGPCGSGVFLGLAGDRSLYLRHFYAVTCHHVAVKLGASIIRINTEGGGSRYIEFEPHEWQFVGNGPDLCAVDVTDKLTDKDEYSALPPSLVISEDFISHEQVEIGEDGFMLGLFADHSGKGQNLVAARFGNLSLLANKGELIEQPNGHKGPCHIFDMHSRPGFSGSPVFVYRTPAGDLRDHADRGRLKRSRRNARPSVSVLGGGDFTQLVDWSPHNRASGDWDDESNTFIMLLGIHVAQYQERVEARKTAKVDGEGDDNIVRDRDQLKIPGSMTIVVPAWEIKNLLNFHIFENQRKARDARMNEE
jgi:hypothetical protein